MLIEFLDWSQRNQPVTKINTQAHWFTAFAVRFNTKESQKIITLWVTAHKSVVIVQALNFKFPNDRATVLSSPTTWKFTVRKKRGGTRQLKCSKTLGKLWESTPSPDITTS